MILSIRIQNWNRFSIPNTFYLSSLQHTKYIFINVSSYQNN